MTFTDDPTPAAVFESPPAPEPERAPTIAATPALFAGLALVAAFFMPLVSAFGGLFTFSPWAYLRLAIDGSGELSFTDWILVALMPVAALLGLAVAVTEARGQRVRGLVGAAAAIPLGLLLYIAIDIRSLDDFRYADMAGYAATAASLVLLCTALGVLDTNASLRRGVYVVCGLLVAAGIFVPASGGSVEDSMNSLFEGFGESLTEGMTEGLDDATDGLSEMVSDDTVGALELQFLVMGQLEEEHDINAIVDCADDLDREVGASTTCTYETFDSEDTFDVEVTISNVEGNDVELDVDPSSEPN